MFTYLFSLSLPILMNWSLLIGILITANQSAKGLSTEISTVDAHTLFKLVKGLAFNLNSCQWNT